MDRHDIPGATAADVAEAHQEDLKVQHRFGCRAITYWFDEQRGTAFCLIEAPDARAVQDMHDTAHGLVPHEIVEVRDGVVEAFLGRIQDPLLDEAHPAIDESALRIIMCVRARRPEADDALRWKERWDELISGGALRHRGRLIEHPGRSGILSFTLASDALRCARHILREAGRNAPEQPSDIRIGISAGNPVTGAEGFFGETLRKAHWFCDIVPRGMVLVSPLVHEVSTGEDSGMRPHGDIAVLSPEDERFLVRMMEFTEATWNTPEVPVAEYAPRIGMSRSQLYRRLTALTGQGPGDFMREYRLNRAADLIEQRFGSISEIALECGFGSLSYFSKCFTRKFGVQPSAYAKSVSPGRGAT
jgi:AraC-like DNA-binding protein